MNLVQLASHTVDLDLLPESPVVLDVGARDFDFTSQLLNHRGRAIVAMLDPAPDVSKAWQHGGSRMFEAHNVSFYNVALVGAGSEAVTKTLAHFSTGEGDFLTEQKHFPGWDKQPTFHEVVCVPTVDIDTFIEGFRFDLVKLDCEGSEFDILEHWPGPVATQISVEFHDWDKPQYRSETYYDALWKKLPWYKVVQHEFSKQGTGVGHWDSLLVLRNGQ